MSLLKSRERGTLASSPTSMRYVINGQILSLLSLQKSKGKTTTTERMLYYSGHTRRIGSMAFALLVILISSIPRKLVLPSLSQPASPNIRNTPHRLNLQEISFLQSHRCRRRFNSHRLLAGRESSRRNNTVRSHLIPLAAITRRQCPGKYDGYE